LLVTSPAKEHRMPIIIWGTRGLESTAETGEFNCPQCGKKEEYVLREVRPYFTLFFIPLFPIGGAERYVRCEGCGDAFKEEVLEYELPRGVDRFAARVHQDLVSGVSLEDVQAKLIQSGVSEAEAVDLLDRVCGGQIKTCACGRQYHPEVTRCNQCGATV
jgi:predicted RNA-binding Zn-ribbon protein involved in translation (DUF1610 family)